MSQTPRVKSLHAIQLFTNRDAAYTISAFLLSMAESLHKSQTGAMLVCILDYILFKYY